MKIASETSQFFFRILPEVDSRLGRGLASGPPQTGACRHADGRIGWQPRRLPQRRSGSPGRRLFGVALARETIPCGRQRYTCVATCARRTGHGSRTVLHNRIRANPHKRIGLCGLTGQIRSTRPGRCSARSILGRGRCEHFCSCCAFPSRTRVPCHRHRVFRCPFQNAKTCGGGARHMPRLRHRSRIRCERPLEPPTPADVRIMSSQSDGHLATDLNHTAEHRPAHHRLFNVAPFWAQNYFQSCRRTRKRGARAGDGPPFFSS
jgi:hypothetical protein